MRALLTCYRVPYNTPLCPIPTHLLSPGKGQSNRLTSSGARTRRPFRLEDCADDVIAVADALRIDTIVPVGYSMGGSIAQLIWRRHRDRVDGLVLCATAPYFAGRRPERLSFVGLTGLATIARYTPTQARAWISEQVYLGTEQGAIAHRDEWFANALAMFDDFQLPIDSGRASDPFFGRAGRILANGQLQEGLKHEVRVQLFEDRQTAIASGNLHQTHFAENFGITRHDGSLAHTSCVGFGVERVAIALLVVHGMSTAAWPAGVRGALGL